MHLDEISATSKLKVTKHTSLTGRKGERETKNADIVLKEQPQVGSGVSTIVQHLGTVRSVARQFHMNKILNT